MPPLKEKASLANPLPMSHLTDVQIASILRFREAGWSTEAIGQNLHHSRHFVSRSLCNSEFEFVERRHNTAQGRLHGLAGHRSRNDCGERESKKNNSLVFFLIFMRTNQRTRIAACPMHVATTASSQHNQSSSSIVSLTLPPGPLNRLQPIRPICRRQTKCFRFQPWGL